MSFHNTPSGMLRMRLYGYEFHKDYEYNDKVYWRCAQKRNPKVNCKCRAVTKWGELVTKKISKHSH